MAFSLEVYTKEQKALWCVWSPWSLYRCKEGKSLAFLQNFLSMQLKALFKEVLLFPIWEYENWGMPELMISTDLVGLLDLMAQDPQGSKVHSSIACTKSNYEGPLPNILDNKQHHAEYVTSCLI